MRLLTLSAIAAAAGLAACDDAPETPGDPRVEAANPYAESETFEFMCGDDLVVEARFLRETARIVVDSATYDLNRVETETGERYEAPNDRELFFWNRDGAATLSLPGDPDRECRLED